MGRCPLGPIPNPAGSQTGGGGLISTREYKQYVDPLLNLLDDGRTGCHVGHVQIAAPTCADDIALVANTPQDMQIMLDLAYNFSKRKGYSLQPKKCVIVTYGPQSTSSNQLSGPWVQILYPMSSQQYTLEWRGIQ